jgi:hypothetical protein
MTSHREQDSIVVQAAARPTPQPLHRLSKSRERVGGDLETQDDWARQLDMERSRSGPDQRDQNVPPA